MERQEYKKDYDNKSNYYGKRPLWQWILIYLVIGGVIYGLIYYFFLGNRAVGTNNSEGAAQQQNTPLFDY